MGVVKHVWRILDCPYAVVALLTLFSFSALAVAFASEAFLRLEPCILCIYQRWPYALVMLLGGGALCFKKYLHIAIGASGIAFLANCGIAFYHTGVEQRWWRSGVEGCTVSFPNDKTQSLLDNIMSAPMAACDSIPWQDPLLNLSMANYNALICLALFVLCLISYIKGLGRCAEETHKSQDRAHDCAVK